MKKLILAPVLASLGFVGFAADYTNVISGTCVGDVQLVSTNAANWKIEFARTAVDAEQDEFTIRLANEEAVSAPTLQVSFSVPQEDIHFVWHSAAESLRLPPKWDGGAVSTLASGMPLMTLINANDGNRLAFAASESVLPVRCRAGLKEQDCTVPCSVLFFPRPTAPMKTYSVKIRLDRRNRRWDDTVRDLTAWMEKSGGYQPMAVPEAAREPLYSTWYAFTQDVNARVLEDEARRAAALGMKTFILDDGWQTDEKGRAYERCGDMKVSVAKFPEGMAAHVKKVQAQGLKYMVWVAVPFVGFKNDVYDKFKGKYLKTEETVYCSVLDPRFPEVRDYLATLFETMLKEWNVDGFKFDYIGQLGFYDRPDGKMEIDPAIAENYAGRDYRSVPDAVDALMTEILRRLRALKPDVLIEYRQPYLSPGIRRFGNMIRAIDCPGEMQKNIVRLSMLRLTSGETAVHSDMLEWHPGDTPERAAKPILASLFSTIQYSVVLSRMPESHLRMMKHWIDFTQRHREALLRGKFTACHPEAHYPIVWSESSAERIMAVYTENTVAPIFDDKPTIVVNATGAASLVLELARPVSVTVFDTFGVKSATRELPAGFCRLDVPVSGYVSVK